VRGGTHHTGAGTEHSLIQVVSETMAPSWDELSWGHLGDGRWFLSTYITGAGLLWDSQLHREARQIFHLQQLSWEKGLFPSRSHLPSPSRTLATHAFESACFGSALCTLYPNNDTLGNSGEESLCRWA
jgi:hypothetical protein